MTPRSISIPTKPSLSNPHHRILLPSLPFSLNHHLRAPNTTLTSSSPLRPPRNTCHRLQSRLHKPQPQPQPRPRPSLYQTQTCNFSATANVKSGGATTHQREDPTPLSSDEYHKRADRYIDALVARLEEMQEEREDVDVEYSSGVLTLIFPPHGTYVLNKQPPNRQIWLSSPVSGPKRYDWVVGGPPSPSPTAGNGDRDEKEKGKGKGEWVYLRDGSTLSGLLGQEVGVVLGEEGGEG